MPVTDFVDVTASESVAPGGGSVAALVGALGGALGTMVANLSAHKRGWDDRWEEFSSAADTGRKATTTLLGLVDEDTRAFNAVMAAMGMAKGSEEERAARTSAIQAATLEAARVPLRVAETACDAMPFLLRMAETGNPASASDAAVGGLCARTAVWGACLNVRTNLPGIEDAAERKALLEAATALESRAAELESAILEVARGKIG
jgi:glutamate formiminotransferase/formiminotetrahydrofolate cyclodeaminase